MCGGGWVIRTTPAFYIKIVALPAQPGMCITSTKNVTIVNYWIHHHHHHHPTAGNWTGFWALNTIRRAIAHSSSVILLKYATYEENNFDFKVGGGSRVPRRCPDLFHLRESRLGNHWATSTVVVEYRWH